MDDYTAAADKLFKEVEHLKMLFDNLDSCNNPDLPLYLAKRVRRESTVLVRALARHRDSYSPEGTSA